MSNNWNNNVKVLHINCIINPIQNKVTNKIKYILNQSIIKLKINLIYFVFNIEIKFCDIN